MSFLCIAFSLRPAGATEYYVAPNGSDAYPGSSVQPWKTISQGIGRLKAGDILHVTPGTYNETVTISGLQKRSGTPYLS